MRHRHFFFALAFASSVTVVQADETPEKAQQAVWEFEMKLSPRSDLPDAKGNKGTETPIREFFAGLKSREMKIAAIGMMDSRYVYHISRDLTAELLSKLIKDPDVKVRARAAHAIGYNVLGHKHVEDLLKLLKEDDLYIKKNAMYGMRGRDKKFLQPLKELLNDKNQQVRMSAAFFLKEYPLQETAAEYRKLLDDKDDVIRATALSYLINDDMVKFLDDRSEAVRCVAISSLVRRPDKDTTSRLVSFLKDPSSNIRVQVLRTLRDLKAKETVLPVTALLADEEVLVRRHALLALEFIGGPDQADKLQLLLKDKDECVREQTARILGLWNAASAAEDLVKLLPDESADVRREAVTALARFGAKKYADALANCLADKNDRVRGAAVRAVGQSGESRFVDRLRAMAENDSNDNVRLACRDAIQELMP